ncbi:hypothetical protein SAMN02745223_02942 [Devosia limi DSM 17137]|uniref:IstB-like ATP-binding domain-containing protein n=1 Tax=Devosia limi DSM 17137 TaxID=1121477 RepID=A0A1M5CJ33_9HYPH|nr:hypothetical protein SAMN02745223_02942 [Devosia limi DSM 17137]
MLATASILKSIDGRSFMPHRGSMLVSAGVGDQPQHSFEALLFQIREARLSSRPFAGAKCRQCRSRRDVAMWLDGVLHLKLPTFPREYQKLARLCATKGVDHVGYLTRLSEREMIERDRRKVERRIKAARLPVVQSLDSFDFAAIQKFNKIRCWNWRVESGSNAGRTSSRLAPAERARPMWLSVSAWQHARRACPSASRQPTRSLAR